MKLLPSCIFCVVSSSNCCCAIASSYRGRIICWAEANKDNKITILADEILSDRTKSCVCKYVKSSKPTDLYNLTASAIVSYIVLKIVAISKKTGTSGTSGTIRVKSRRHKSQQVCLEQITHSWELNKLLYSCVPLIEFFPVLISEKYELISTRTSSS